MRATAAFLTIFLLSQCRPIDLFERTVNIPLHQWASDFSPRFTFNLSDSQALYEVALVLRHTDAYPYNNIWLDIEIEAPDTLYRFRTEGKLGDNEKGWLGTGIQDVYEHRIPLNRDLEKAGVSFRKAGTYTFRLTQIMREDPLPHVLQAGIRVERKK